MIHYKDMTFCKDQTCARFGVDCHRAFTDDHAQAAKRLWGSDDAPVAFFGERVDCYEEKKP